MRYSADIRKPLVNFVSILLLLLLALFPTAALAASATSTPKTVTLNGHSYSYYTKVATESGNAYAWTYANATNGSVPTGYMGANSTLYKEGIIPTAVASRDWAYNTSTSSSHTRGCGMTASSGNYYAAGQVRFYNGSGYNTYTANRSPSLTYSGALAAYQSQQFSGLWAVSDDFYQGRQDLILAEGVNGGVGYIRYEDLGFDYTPSTPEEAVAYTLSQPDVRYIPVYDKDGVTVIDEYPVFGGDSSWDAFF